jgi:hypothetical protein
VPELCITDLNRADLAVDQFDSEWLEDITEAYHDPATGRPQKGWPPLEVHLSLPVLAACNLYGPAPNGPSAYSRCVTLSSVFAEPAYEPISEASARLVAEKVKELGLANNVLDPDRFSERPGAGVILDLGRYVMQC